MRLIILSIVFLLTGCSSPKVMIVNQGVAPETIEKISADFQSLGYRVELSTALVPENFTDAAIATNPSITDPAILDPIKGILVRAGFDSPHHYQFAQGNHYYSPDHFGVYLRNPNVRLMPPIMGSRRCGNFSATIEYFPNGTLLFEYEKIDENGSVILEGQSNGHYHASGNQVVLTFPPYKALTLQIHQDKVDTYAGLRRADYVHLPLQPLLRQDQECRLDAVYE